MKWKRIGNKRNYVVFENGKVFSLRRHGRQSEKRTPIKAKELIGIKCKRKHTTYLTVNINGKILLIHRLVGKAFIPNPENKCCINHIDNNGENNNVNNLEWVTHSENMIHAQKQGRLYKTQSKAGQKIAFIKRIQTRKKYNNYINQIFNSFKILNWRRKDNKYIYGDVLCLKCNNIYTRELSSIIAGNHKMCRKCSSKRTQSLLNYKKKMKI